MRHIKTNSLIIGMIGSILGGCGGSTAIEDKALQTSSNKGNRSAQPPIEPHEFMQ